MTDRLAEVRTIHFHYVVMAAGSLAVWIGAIIVGLWLEAWGPLACFLIFSERAVTRPPAAEGGTE